MALRFGRNSFLQICLCVFLLVLWGCGGGNETPPARPANAPPPPSQHVANSPPVISQVQLTPEKAYVYSSVTAIVTGHDPDGNPVSYSFEWRVNGNVVSKGNENRLNLGSFRKGDQIDVLVTPSDGDLSGEAKQSSPLTIVNSPPRIRSVNILPRPAYKGDRLEAQVDGEDLDGDGLSSTFEWLRNGQPIIGQGTQYLPADLLKKGDRISAAVTPFDGESRGTRVVSPEVVIANSAPVISSQPPVGPAANNVYVYNVTATDPDGDPITFSLGPSAPKGMTIDPQSGKIQWAMTPESSGAYMIEIIVTDKEGAKSVQRYRLTVSMPSKSSSQP